VIPTFSLRQVLLTVVAIAAGCAIARLPQGRWLDVPLAALSCFLIVSLTRDAEQLLRMTSGPHVSFAEARWGSRMFASSLLATAATLLLALALRFAAAAQLLFQTTEDDFDLFFDRHLLPSSLAMLAILTAVLLGQWRRCAMRVVPRRQRLFDVAAIVCLPVVIIAHWWDNLLIWVLVYYALWGVDVGATYVNMPAPHIDSMRGAAAFALGSYAGLPLIAMHLILLGGLVYRWHDPRWRAVLLAGLTIALIGETFLLWWLAGPGLEQLTPYYRQTLRIPPWPLATVGLALVLLGSLMLAWRMLSGRAFIIDTPVPETQQCWFHEHWSSGLFVAVVALFGIATFAVQVVLTYDTLDIAYAAVQYPTNFIWFAALISGLGTFRQRFRTRREPQQRVLPRVSPAQFAVTFVGLVALLLVSAPILVASTFSMMLIYLGSSS
jgi:hypothetical protein